MAVGGRSLHRGPKVKGLLDFEVVQSTGTWFGALELPVLRPGPRDHTGPSTLRGRRSGRRQSRTRQSGTHQKELPFKRQGTQDVLVRPPGHPGPPAEPQTDRLQSPHCRVDVDLSRHRCPTPVLSPVCILWVPLPGVGRPRPLVRVPRGLDPTYHKSLPQGPFGGSGVSLDSDPHVEAPSEDLRERP